MRFQARRSRRRAVLIENRRADSVRSQRDHFQAAGFDVTTCPGPARYPSDHGCDLLTTGGCALIEATDVLVYDLDLDEPTDREVLRAVRHRRPDLPVVVEVPGRTVRRHEDVLEGCTVVLPYSPARLTEAVRTAAG